MANLEQATMLENEIIKAQDFNFFHRQQFRNIELAISSLIGGNGRDFVIGGGVSPYGSGGMNVQVEGMLVYSGASGRIGIETEVTKPVSLEAADDTYDRIDTVQVAIEETGYDEQSRVFINPDTKVKSNRFTDTKKKVVLNITIKRGEDDAGVAPSPDAGCVKIAEISVPARIQDITSELIENVVTRVPGGETRNWTSDKTVTFSLNFTTLLQSFLAEHTNEGEHKENSIDSTILKLGVSSDELNSSLVPIGESMTLGDVAHESTESTKNMVKALVSFCDEIQVYSNSIFSRYSVVKTPIKGCTDMFNISDPFIDKTGFMADDEGKPGDIVFVNSDKVWDYYERGTAGIGRRFEKKERGLWEVQSRKWNRPKGYENGTHGFDNKLFPLKGGLVYLPKKSYEIGKDSLDFKGFTLPHLQYDRFGRAKVAAPVEEDEIAVKATVTAEENARKEYEKQLTGHYDSCDGRNLLTVLGVQDVAQAMAKLHQKCSDGDFSGLMIGDYLDLPSFFGGQRIVISGFNQYYGCGDTENSRQHILWMLKFGIHNTNFRITQKGMNSTDTNEGGYPASAMKTFLDGEVATALREALGGDYLYTVRRATSHKGSTGWDSFTVFLPTEVEVFGNSTYGDDLCGWNTCVQFPIFRNSSYYFDTFLDKRDYVSYYYWLGTPNKNNSTDFCCISYQGIPASKKASNYYFPGTAFLIRFCFCTY